MSTTISPCGQYRFWLSRPAEPGFEHLPHVVFVMLNPSTADGTHDDPTIRRCRTFARGAAFGVVNLCPIRATKPADMRAWVTYCPDADAIAQNDAHLAEVIAQDNFTIIGAWGTHAEPTDVQYFVNLCDAFGKQVYCIGTNNNGSPKHPLYVASDTPIVPWVPIVRPDTCYVCDGVGCLTCQRRGRHGAQ